MKEGALNNPERVGRARKTDKQKAQQADDDFKAVMSTPQGRRFVHRLVYEFCRFGAVTMPGTTSEDTLRHEGQRVAGSEILKEAMRVTPFEFSLAYAEALQERANEEMTKQQGDKHGPADDAE